jgi:hypothetical protein
MSCCTSEGCSKSATSTNKKNVQVNTTTAIPVPEFPPDRWYTTNHLRPDPPRAFEERLKTIASEYLQYAVPNWMAKVAPTSCIGPPPPAPDFSTSVDSGTHGRKLYFLFAADPQSYEFRPASQSPVGQALVKESWTAEPVSANATYEKIPHACGIQVWPYASDGKTTYRAGEKKELFIMFKTDPSTPGTDEGWVYGTVSPDGQHVTSSGRVESCMKCHQTAPHDRLFGLAKAEDVTPAAR